MNRTHFFLMTFFFAGLMLAELADTPLSISEIETRLFYHHSGTLSEKLTGKEPLWNTPIGGGWADEPSQSMLVDVIVSGSHGSYHDSVVELTAKKVESDKIVSEQSQHMGILSKSGKYHVPFLVNDIGCEPLQLTARINGTSEKREVVIPFECGE